MRSSRLAVFFAFMFPLWVNAQEPGDSRAGLTFARANCAECHAIKDTEVKSPNPNAPTFASVAKTPGMTGRALAVWLQTSHPTMPNFLVAEKDRDNVIAYIMSLQPTPAQ
jgi:mono/diheme cytochrome c family protein